jgi:hypothetical protein
MVGSDGSPYSPACLVVASDDDLFLLDGQRAGSQRRRLSLDDAGVEGVLAGA